MYQHVWAGELRKDQGALLRTTDGNSGDKGSKAASFLEAPTHFPADTTSERHFPILPLEGRNIPRFHRRPFSSLPHTHMLKTALARLGLGETDFNTLTDFNLVSILLL